MDKTKNDLDFLVEMKGHLENSHRDVSRREMLECMINDWIHELEQKIASPSPVSVSDEEIERIALALCPVNMQPNGRTIAGGKYEHDENYGIREMFIQSAKWMRSRLTGNSGEDNPAPSVEKTDK